MKITIPDQAIRQRALDPCQSFLVQAPAGSGKTELLTQRYLALLATVRRPESIVAITFTRKAAAEMKARLIAALQRAQNDLAPESAHERQTWELARQVLVHDQALSWHLLTNQNRLRLTTIDSLCAQLTQQMPLLSKLGGQLQLTESPEVLYEQAVQQLLNDLNEPVVWKANLQQVLRHLDNRLDLVQPLLIAMLAQREQWLDVVQEARHHHNLREVLEQALVSLADAQLARVVMHLPENAFDELDSLLQFSRAQLGLSAISITTGIPYWQAIADMLLSQTGNWRKVVDKRIGFPNPKDAPDMIEKGIWKAKKESIKQLLEQLSSNPTLEQALADIRYIPEPQYPEAQWKMLEALLEILPVLAAHLRVVFAEKGQVDFVEMALSALHALGADDAPTDLALQSDAVIQHLLVDEFQDTSQLQYQLLQRLTRGWQPGDSRTLFCVGDPMQSIYRFRQADVSLFLRCKAEGINDIRFEFLQLQANFRSDPRIIEWVNRSFAQVFPQQDDVLHAAVSYSDSVAMRAQDSTVSQSLQYFWHQDELSAAQAIASALPEASAGSVAILVRSRSHLQECLHELQRAKIAYQAVDVETLADRAVVQDLLSLTLALRQPADRLSWLAILRAPWCGIGLADLTRIAQFNAEQTVIESLQNTACLQLLSDSAQHDLAVVVPVLLNALNQRDRSSLRDRVELCWQALQGPACVSPEDVENANRYFDLLTILCESGRLLNTGRLEQRLWQLRAQTIAPDAAVQVMTIHKSKGLEFDTVILLGLHKAPRASQKPILRWEAYRLPNGQQDVLLAPIKRQDEQMTPIYQLLDQRDQQKAHYETQRLLYVAATRAKKRLWLSGVVTHDSKGNLKPPVSTSLLALLWPVLKDQVVLSEEALAFETIAPDTRSLRRLVREAVAPTMPETLTLGLNRPVLPTLQQLVAQAVGTVVHRYLAALANQSELQQAWQRICRIEAIQVQLKALQIPESELAAATTQVLTAIDRTVEDDIGRWILKPHPITLTEQSFWHCEQGRWQESVIDRAFVEGGTLWLIDYKTAMPSEDENLEDFAANQLQQYREQLDRYAACLRQQYPGLQVRAGLYFAMLGNFAEAPEIAVI